VNEPSTPLFVVVTAHAAPVVELNAAPAVQPAVEVVVVVVVVVVFVEVEPPRLNAAREMAPK
jgi:hypothetical protein